ncbi:MAG: class I SAM-dependent methyltransferase [Candidatus Eremiobacteraeota bacterium]|nr:class I SAM-dependent methyltransferase [Candidatus Eremiobacteraeota bacterium]
MGAIRIKKLDDSQVAKFDHDFVSEARFAATLTLIDRDVPSGVFSFLDIGGGRGFFADRILDHYPRATGTLLDNSGLMLEQNELHSRKTLVLGSVEDAHEVLPRQQYDIIFLNFALHHFIVNSYAKTRALQRATLAISGDLLGPTGRISIVENMCNGAVLQNWPSFVIFQLTSSKVLAPLVRRLGANTAGVGVCFLDKRQWRLEIARAGLRVFDYEEEYYKPMARVRRLALLMRSYHVGHFWVGR